MTHATARRKALSDKGTLPLRGFSPGDEKTIQTFWESGERGTLFSDDCYIHFPESVSKTTLFYQIAIWLVRNHKRMVESNITLALQLLDQKQYSLLWQLMDDNQKMWPTVRRLYDEALAATKVDVPEMARVRATIVEPMRVLLGELTRTVRSTNLIRCWSHHFYFDKMSVVKSDLPRFSARMHSLETAIDKSTKAIHEEFVRARLLATTPQGEFYFCVYPLIACGLPLLAVKHILSYSHTGFCKVLSESIKDALEMRARQRFKWKTFGEEVKPAPKRLKIGAFDELFDENND